MTLHNIKEEKPEFKTPSPVKLKYITAHTKHVVSILNLHDIEHTVVNGKVFAGDGEEITGKSNEELKLWLGY
jgi:hypothetical protein